MGSHTSACTRLHHQLSPQTSISYLIALAELTIEPIYLSDLPRLMVPS